MLSRCTQAKCIVRGANGSKWSMTSSRMTSTMVEHLLDISYAFGFKKRLCALLRLLQRHPRQVWRSAGTHCSLERFQN